MAGAADTQPSVPGSNLFVQLVCLVHNNGHRHVCSKICSTNKLVLFSFKKIYLSQPHQTHKQFFSINLPFDGYVFVGPNESLLEHFQGGIYLFQLMDFYSASGMSLLWVCFFQTIAIGWFFGAERFCDCVEQMTGRRPGMFWFLCWKYFAPAVMLVRLYQLLVKSCHLPLQSIL